MLYSDTETNKITLLIATLENNAILIKYSLRQEYFSRFKYSSISESVTIDPAGISRVCRIVKFCFENDFLIP